MRLTIRILGAEVFHADTDPEHVDHEDHDELGSCTTYPIGFTAPPETPREDPGWDRGDQ